MILRRLRPGPLEADAAELEEGAGPHDVTVTELFNLIEKLL